MNKKLEFRALVSLIVGSQIGTGAFLLPSSLAGVGSISLLGWFVSALGAILLALIFSKLSLMTFKGRGPHVYIGLAFGKKTAFFSAWTYWLISWLSSIAVILAFVGYLSPLIGITHPFFLLFLEILLITLVTGLNILGVRVVGSMEFYLTILKCLPLIIIPLGGIFYFQKENLHPLHDPNNSLLASLNTSTLMTFWGFIGLEMANILAGLTDNHQKNVPRAIILGTLLVAFIYIFSNIGIIGVLPRDILAKSPAPFAEVGRIIFGFGWERIISIFALMACLGTLNAWVLASGHVAAEASKEGLFPNIFSKTNKFGAPYMGLIISLLAIIPILVTTMSPSILTQLNYIIDVSVLTFVVIYLLSMISFIKISWDHKKISPFYLGVSILAIAFCIWILAYISIMNLIWCTLFVCSGIPVYFWNKKVASLSS